MESYGEALDPSTSEMVKMFKKPLEGLQIAKSHFFKRVATFSDVLQV